MATSPETFAELATFLADFGDIPPERILLRPLPGTATEADLIALLDGPRKRLCELVDGVLVEKPVGAAESLLGATVLRLLGNFVEERDLGLTFGADAPFRLLPGLVRMPDVSFVSWARLPDERLPDEALAPVAPDLAVEVLSPSNTKKEMQRKLRDFFLAGVREAWLIYPKTQTAEVYTAPDKKRRIARTGTLDGGAIIPGFRLPLADLFARMNRRKRA
jgi:Uma2 family endonuclease